MLAPDNQDVISARQLSKHYRVKVRDPGLGGAIRSIFAPRYDDVIAVDKLAFTIERGEVVAFLGPNGAGKTTTLKMITGLLYPTSGQVTVAGFDPWMAPPEFKRRISLVLGNKQQLLWDLPVEETFRLNRAIYGVSPRQYVERKSELVTLLELDELLDRPVRNLSLGERMKCELAAALLHQPELIMLDEPTLGLDVNAQDAVRGFLNEYAARHNATILLTSHYMADVTALAKRVMMIDQGRLVYDGSLSGLVARTAPVKRIELTLCPEVSEERVAQYGVVRRFQYPHALIEVPRDQAARVSARLLTDHVVADLSIQDLPIEDVIRQAFAEARDGDAR